jgi:hypothetical protein
MRWKYLYLFLAGFFFGGTIDHMIFAIRKTPAPYGIYLGVTGNILMAFLDLAIAAVLFFIFKRKNNKT